jgi:molybdenum cofactor cytidylyltransferase
MPVIPSQPFGLGVVLLAAGASSRMKQPKLLLPWNGTSILGHLISQWRTLGAKQIAVVCAAGDKSIAQELDRLGFPSTGRILNPAPERGMFSSIQCAAHWPGWNAHLSHWAIVLGDQPHLSIALLQQVLDWTARHRAQICQPSRHRRPRHPVLMPSAAFQQLAAAECSNLKEFLQLFTNKVALCEIDDPGLDSDLDTPDDYQKAVRAIEN